MIEQLQPRLTLLDEGLSLYRRNFVPFLLISASWFVPVAIAAGLIAVMSTWLDPTPAIITGIIAFLLFFPLLLYLIGGLSRAAAAAIDGKPVSFRSAMAIKPKRAIGMGFFGIVYSIIAQIVAGVLSFSCICPLYAFMAAGVFGVAGLAEINENLGILGGMLLALVFVVIYGLLPLISVATFNSTVYAFQPWVQEQRPFSETFQRSFELVGYNIWRNIIDWFTTALLLSAGGMVIILAVGVVVPAPLLFFLGEESAITRLVAATAWTIGLVFVLPPLPIWMALLYRRNSAARAGVDLDAKVQEWWRQCFGDQESGVRSQESGVRSQESGVRS
jgi:hypothetical protein